MAARILGVFYETDYEIGGLPGIFLENRVPALVEKVQLGPTEYPGDFVVEGDSKDGRG